MRPINQLIIHCSATNEDQDIGVDEIREWHTAPKPKGNGWSDVGYHYVICRDGMLEEGRPVSRPGAHAKGYNKESIGICLVGGIDKQGRSIANFTMAQYVELYDLIRRLLKKHPGAQLLGHRDLPGVAKDCPCFSVGEFFKVGGLL